MSSGMSSASALSGCSSDTTPVFTVPAAHRDYIRAGAPSPVDHNLFATGSYDQSVKLWDARTGKAPALSLSHGASVESVLFLPSGGLLATAGGTTVKIWDVIGGGRLVHSVESHVKTIFALALGKMGATGETRLLSAGSDGYVKCFDYGELKMTHSMRRKKNATEEVEEEVVSSEFAWTMPKPEKQALKPSYYRYFLRGQNEKAKQGDFVISRPKKANQEQSEEMEELVARRKLVRCIGNLDVAELGLLLDFLHRNATLPRYARLLLGVANKVLEMRAEDIISEDGGKLKGCIRNLKRMVVEEIKIQHTLQEIQGMISPMLALSASRLK
ncbi:U3 small nucleolar RNA-associated protein 15-like protein [Triticum urartu]|uniref:U3 small nucleolar RNA-associated protein 15-like protein n=1 Tax=Triticum urartu TaxID=4572 RepID=M7ZFZ6_TRIUA|nr:U3 small nucleolar RNA-associated protein 15-like protein [Triticum urartu]